MANDKIICKCYKVTEKDIKKAIKKGAESAKDIRNEIPDGKTQVAVLKAAMLINHKKG